MARVIVLGAGGNPGNNVVRCLNRGGHYTIAADLDPYMLELTDARVRAVLETRADAVGHLDEILMLIDEWNADLVIPMPEREVLALAGIPEPWIVGPPIRPVEICQDKLECAMIMEGLGIGPRTWEITRSGGDDAEYPAWVRSRNGAGSTAALDAQSEYEASVWMSLWIKRNPKMRFMASEILPGKSMSWTGLWWRGTLIARAAMERVALLGARQSITGDSSTATVQRTVNSQLLDDLGIVATNAVFGRDAPHGPLKVDFRCDAQGLPKVTEINVGRFGTTVDHYAQAGVNMPDLLARLVEGQDVTALPWDMASECYWIRNTDCEPRVASVRRFS